MIIARDTHGKTWWLLRFMYNKQIMATKTSPVQAVALPASMFKSKDKQALREARAREGKGG